MDSLPVPIGPASPKRIELAHWLVSNHHVDEAMDLPKPPSSGLSGIFMSAQLTTQGRGDPTDRTVLWPSIVERHSTWTLHSQTVHPCPSSFHHSNHSRGRSPFGRTGRFPRDVTPIPRVVPTRPHGQMRPIEVSIGVERCPRIRRKQWVYSERHGRRLLQLLLN